MQNFRKAKTGLPEAAVSGGAYFVLRKIIEECSLKDILGKYFGSRDMGLFLDLAVYLIIAENNAAQYYSDYTYNHPLLRKR